MTSKNNVNSDPRLNINLFNFYISLPQERVYEDEPIEQILIDKGYAVSVDQQNNDGSGAITTYLYSKEQVETDRIVEQAMMVDAGLLNYHSLYWGRDASIIDPVNVVFAPGEARLCWFGDASKQAEGDGYFVYVENLKEAIIAVKALVNYAPTLDNVSEWHVWTLELLTDGEWVNYVGPRGESIAEALELIGVDPEEDLINDEPIMYYVNPDLSNLENDDDDEILNNENNI